MSRSYFLNKKQFIRLNIGLDTITNEGGSMFWFSNHWSEYSSTKNLFKPPIRGLRETFFIEEQNLLPSCKEWFMPVYGCEETLSLKQNGINFLSTYNANEGFIASLKSDQNKQLSKPFELVGLSTQDLCIKTYSLLGNFEEYSLSFYKSVSDWRLDNASYFFNQPVRDENGLWEIGQELKFRVVSLRVKSLNQAHKLLKIQLFRPGNFYHLSNEELLKFSFTQEVKGEAYACGLTTGNCEFSFIDGKRIFDCYNPLSPFYGLDLRNFLIRPRLDYFKDANFDCLQASYNLGEFYGETVESSFNEGSTCIKACSLLNQVRNLKTKRHYYMRASLSQVLEDLFLDVGLTVLIQACLSKVIISYRFFGGSSLESSLKELCETYHLIVSQNSQNKISVRRVKSYASYAPKAFFDLSNEFKYVPSTVDKVINRLKVKETQYTLSDKDLEKYWVKELLPSFDDKGCMQVKKVRLSLDAKEQEIEVLDNAQSLLELPKLLKYSSTRAKIYPARHPITKRPPATLEYKVLLPYSFDKKRESYISDLVFSKNNKTESQPSYLEFEWSSQDCLFQHQESSLLSVKIWAYATACYEKVVYKRNSGDSLEYDSNGFAIIIAAHEYKKNEEKQSLLYGEAQIVPPLKERGKLLKTLKVTLAPSSEKIKVIDNYTKNRAQKLEFEASVGQVWDRMESDLYLSEEMKQHLWIEESFGEDGLRIRYLNLSSNDFTYEVKVYGRSFVKIEQNVRVWENLESQAIYCQREEERENLSDKEIETYLHWHAKPWQSISVETIGNPDLEVGDIIQVLSQQEVLSKAQLIKSVFRLEDGALPISQLTCLGLVNSCCRSLTREFLGSIGEMHLGS